MDSAVFCFYLKMLTIDRLLGGHFFTMGAGADVNIVFAICTMIIAIPTGVKVFNWLFTMFRGRIHVTQPLLWFYAFVPCFLVGGTTGVMPCCSTCRLSIS